MSRQHLTGRAGHHGPRLAPQQRLQPLPAGGGSHHQPQAGEEAARANSDAGASHGGSPTPRQHRSGSRCCRAARAAPPAAHSWVRLSQQGRKELWQLHSLWCHPRGWKANSPPRVIESPAPQIPMDALLEGQRPAGRLYPSPDHSLAPLAKTTSARPSPTCFPQPLPQPRRPLPGPSAKWCQWGTGR